MDQNLSLEQLENDYWDQPEFDSNLVKKCHELRKKPIKNMTVEDLRILIGQNIGLEFLIPKAIGFLEHNILSEGDFYEGDLLQNVLSSAEKYWLRNQEAWSIVCQLFRENRSRLEEFEITDEIKEKWFKSFSNFESINK